MQPVIYCGDMFSFPSHYSDSLFISSSLCSPNCSPHYEAAPVEYNYLLYWHAHNVLCPYTRE